MSEDVAYIHYCYIVITLVFLLYYFTLHKSENLNGLPAYVKDTEDIWLLIISVVTSRLNFSATKKYPLCKGRGAHGNNQMNILHIDHFQSPDMLLPR
jgi:hypothetical protein